MVLCKWAARHPELYTARVDSQILAMKPRARPVRVLDGAVFETSVLSMTLEVL